MGPDQDQEQQSPQKQDNSNQTDFVDYKVAMEFLGLSQSTFFRRVKAGVIPSYEDSLGGQRMFKMSELQILKANRYKPANLKNET
jgi:predicted DNA-binding transcriptional regulator AlpA